MKGKRVFTKEEVQRMIQHADPRESILIKTGLTFCTRIGETLALTFGDFNGSTVEIVAAKRGEKETYPIPDFYREALEELRAYYAEQHIFVDDNTPLLVSRKGRQQAITPRQAIRMLQTLCERLGIHERIGTHSLRKTGLTHKYIESGFDLAVTRRYSRHKSLAMLQYYIGTTDNLDLVNKAVWA